MRWRFLLYFLRIAALVLLVLGFARPQTATEFVPDKGQGIDMMLCIDISQSMTGDIVAQGSIPMSKLEVAKQEAMHFIDQRPSDRIGAVVFTGEALTTCPLTTDHSSLKMLISNIECDPRLEQGTVIGMGLANAVERLRDSNAKSKIVVLLTDGENNKGMIQPLDAGRIAKTYNVRVYTIGLGAQGRQLTPVMTNPDGSVVQQYRDVDIDESTMIQISNITGGKYFRASDGKKLEQVYKEISQMEKTDFNTKGHWHHKEEAAPFFLLALLLLGAEFTLRYTVFDSLT